jgi:hypothetical protein
LNQNELIINGKLKNLKEQFHNEISNKIKVYIFTATANGITNVVHNLSYDPQHDDLLVIYDSVILEKDVNYTENLNNISIDLLDWYLNSAEKINFRLYKNVK